MGNQEWTVQKQFNHRKHWAHKTQDEDKQNRKKTLNTTQKTKKYEQHVPYQTTICEPWCSKGVSSS
jgi:hypothetical protein